MKLSDLKIIITGAAGGIGSYFTKELIAEGAYVSAWDIDAQKLSALVKEINSPRLHSLEIDVTKEDAVVLGVEASFKALGGLNSLINNAGIFDDGFLVKKKENSLVGMPFKQWSKVLDVNLNGTFLCAREFSRKALEQKSQSVIINISSISRGGNLGQSNYSAAKAGVIADTVTWSKELSSKGIRVAAIAPGFINTPMLEGMNKKVLSKVVDKIPLKRLGEPKDIYLAAKFIIQCDYFTGRCIEVDGGLRL